MPECRICLETGEVDDLITPCNCRGSSQWVHSVCLNEWRSRNINAISNEKCEICLFNYVISYAEKKETYIIGLYEYKYPIIEFFLSMFLTFTIGNLILFIESQNGYQSIKFFDLEHINNEFIFKEDIWFIWAYYQSLSSFVLNILFITIFNIISVVNVVRKKRYFCNMLCVILTYFLYTSNLLFIIYLSKLTKLPTMIGFWCPIFVSMQFSFWVKYIKKHNKILLEINEDLPNEVVNSFQINPLNDFVPLTITEYSHNQVD